MNIVVHEPVKKLKNYVAKVTHESGKPLRLRVCASFMAFAPLDKGGRTMRIHIQDEDTASKLSQIDDFVRAETISRNATWFDNDMNDDDINTLFRDSLNKVRNTVTVLLSDTKEANWYRNDICLDREEPLQPGTSVVLDLEVQGLFFYPKKFGIRWIVRNVYLDRGAGADTDASDDVNDHALERAHIEAAWRLDVAEFTDKLDNDIEVMHANIAKLQNTKASVASALNEACAMETMDAEWDKRFRALAKKYAAYLAGGLMS